MSDLNKISQDSSLSVLSIDEAKGKSPFDSGVVWLIDWRLLFNRINYVEPEDLWKYKNVDQIFDSQKYLADELRYARRHIVREMKDSIQENYFVLTETAGISEQEAKRLSSEKADKFKQALDQLDFDTLKSLFINNQELTDRINDMQKDHVRRNDHYITLKESFLDEEGVISSDFLAHKFRLDYLSGTPGHALLMIAEHIKILTEQDFQKINDAIMQSLIQKISNKQYLQFLEILDQVDFFQQTYGDIWFRFARNADLPEILKPKVLRKLGLHSSIDWFKNAIRSVYAHDKAQQDLLIQQADEYYDHDNFFYWRLITTSPSYALKKYFIEKKSTHSIQEYQSMLIQILDF